MNNELVPQPSWWKRNWKWVVPVGGCLSLIVIFVVFLGSLFYGISNAFEGSEPHVYALELVNENETLVGIMGTPIEKDGIGQSSFNWNNGNKTSNLVIPIAGPKAKATLYVDARGTDDAWIYDRIEVIVPENEPINLLEEKAID